MVGHGTRRFLPLAGVATCALVAVAALGWAVGLDAAAAAAGLAAFATGAAAAGVDSRASGDWTETPRR